MLSGNDDEVVLGVDALVAEAEARTGCCAACGEDADGNGVNTQGQGTNVVCTICMCAVSNPVRLPCNHVFCTRPCLQSWVHRSDYCPNCRALIIVSSILSAHPLSPVLPSSLLLNASSISQCFCL